MCSINHDLKAIFIHIPKTAGIYIRSTLEKYYCFDLYLLKRPDHETFCNTNLKYNGNSELNLTFCCNKGVISYYKSSPELNEIMDLDDEKWKNYKKFCVVRNPYAKAISAWKYLMRTLNLNIDFGVYLKFKDIVSENEYWHLFISQYENLIDENNELLIDYIIKFENLENEFQSVLNKIGIDKICHDDLIVKNKSESDDYYKNYYNQESLKIINEIYEKDFDFFNYKMYDNIDDFMNN